MKGICAALALLLVGACEHLKVEEIGGGHYTLTAVSPSGGYNGSHEEAVEQANEYCERSHQTAVIEGFNDKPDLGLAGEHTSVVTFSCGAPQPLHF
jgi:hypothetical protein